MNVSNPLKGFTLKGAILVLALIPSLLMASPRLPSLGMVNGEGGAFLIIMPENHGYDVYQRKQEPTIMYPPKAIVYTISASGEPQKAWQSEGWYEFPNDLYLSYGGKTIVRIRDYYVWKDGSYNASSDQDLIAFYQASGKIAGYSAAELFTDTKKAIQWDGSIGSPLYQWFHREGAKRPSFQFYPTPEQAKLGMTHTSFNYAAQYFELYTLEYGYRFDVSTGEILSREPYE